MVSLSMMLYLVGGLQLRVSLGKHDLHNLILSAFIEDLGFCDMHFVIPGNKSLTYEQHALLEPRMEIKKSTSNCLVMHYI